MSIRITLPENIKYVINTLIENGHEAFAVGGCIRDSLLGRTPHDWDVTTSASPSEVKSIFPRTFDTGIQHGTVTVLLGKEAVEITTYRIDGIYEDNRHPSEVTFTKELSEDLRRRDFTMNAIAYNDTAGLVDPFRGYDDLKNGIIRCVGNATERFHEDALRIMRAVRFSAQLGFSIEEETEKAIRENSGLLVHISAERIAAELIKLITSDSPEKIRTAYELGITRVILPEFDEMMITPQQTEHHIYTVGDHTVKSLMNIRPDRVLRLTMLLHDIGKPEVRIRYEDGSDHFRTHSRASERIGCEIMRRLKLDNDTIRKVSLLIRYHDWHLEPDEPTVRLLIHYVGKDLFPLLLEVQKADLASQSSYLQETKENRIDTYSRLFHIITERGDCTEIRELRINGNDLMDLGYRKGPAIGEVLNEALTEVLKDHRKNTKEYLTEFAKNKLTNSI